MEQEYKMEEHLVEEYCDYLRQEEKAKDTIQKYRLDLMQFFNFLPREKIITKQVVISYKEMLAEKYKISSANSKIAVVNAFLMYKGWQECKVKRYKMQRHIFCDQEKDVVRLADILGHSSIETSRIYTVSSGWEHVKQMERLRLVVG